MADLKTATNVQDQASPTLPAPAESLRLIVDSIPGIVSTLNAAVDVEFVNRPSLEYTGKTSEESKK
jgi:PAS domain-containing protein